VFWSRVTREVPSVFRNRLVPPTVLTIGLLLLFGTSATGADDLDALVESFARKAPDAPSAGFREGSFLERAAAVQAELMERGARAVPALKRGLTHYFPIVRQMSFETLVELRAGPRDLRPALEDADPALRYAAGKHFIHLKRKEGIDAVVSCLRLTSDGDRRSIYAGFLRHVTGREGAFDWEGATAKEAEAEVRAWEDWWAKKRRGFRFPRDATIYVDLEPMARLEEVEELDPRELAALATASRDPSRKAEVTEGIEALLEGKEELVAEQILECVSCLNRVGAHDRALELCQRVTDEANRDRGVSFDIYNEQAHYETAVACKGLGKIDGARVAIHRARTLKPDDEGFEAFERGLKSE
jgi:hypothetical protein